MRCVPIADVRLIRGHDPSEPMGGRYAPVANGLIAERGVLQPDCGVLARAFPERARGR